MNPLPSGYEYVPVGTHVVESTWMHVLGTGWEPTIRDGEEIKVRKEGYYCRPGEEGMKIYYVTFFAKSVGAPGHAVVRAYSGTQAGIMVQQRLNEKGVKDIQFDDIKVERLSGPEPAILHLDPVNH